MPEIDKAPHSKCPHVTATGCGIYKSDRWPKVCEVFKCAWMHGLGEDEFRPDKIGAMFTLNITPAKKIIGFCIETEPDAITTSAQRMAVLFVRNLHAPIIVVKHGTLPPEDKGDYVVVRKDQELKCVTMLGKHMKAMAPDVNLFELKRYDG